MDAILCSKPATCPPVVVDTLEDSSDIQDDGIDPEHEITDEIAEEFAQESGSIVSASEENSMPKSRTTPSPSPAVIKKPRKRKDKAESTVAEMFQKVAECQSATEQKLMELEEKRFKLDGEGGSISTRGEGVPVAHDPDAVRQTVILSQSATHALPSLYICTFSIWKF